TDLSPQVGDEIVAPLHNLRLRVVALNGEPQLYGSKELNWQSVSVAYHPTVYNSASPSDRRSARCIAATVRVCVAHIVQGDKASADLASNMHCHCDGSSQCRPGDTSIMAW